MAGRRTGLRRTCFLEQPSGRFQRMRLCRVSMENSPTFSFAGDFSLLEQLSSSLAVMLRLARVAAGSLLNPSSSRALPVCSQRSLKLSLGIASFYLCWILVCSHFNGIFPYPFLNKLPWPQVRANLLASTRHIMHSAIVFLHLSSTFCPLCWPRSWTRLLNLCKMKNTSAVSPLVRCYPASALPLFAHKPP